MKTNLIVTALVALGLACPAIAQETKKEQEAYTAGEVYWVLKQKYPQIKENTVKALFFDHLAMEQPAREWNRSKVDAAFEAGARSSGEPGKITEENRVMREHAIKALHP